MLVGLSPLERWPPVSRALHLLATLVHDHGIGIATGLIVGLVMALWTLPRWMGRGRAFCDRYLPPWTVYREYQSSVLLIAIAAMTAASQSLEDAVGDMQGAASPWMRRHLQRIRIGLREGWEPPRALDTGLFDKELIGRFEDYQSAGALLQVLARIGERAVRDANRRIAATASVIRNALFFVVGGLLLWTYAGVVFVLIDLSKSMSAMPH
jgi:type II secretory pathway component PulF